MNERQAEEKKLFFFLKNKIFVDKRLRRKSKQKTTNKNTNPKEENQSNKNVYTD